MGVGEKKNYLKKRYADNHRVGLIGVDDYQQLELFLSNLILIFCRNLMNKIINYFL